jgi:hypothetical protein
MTVRAYKPKLVEECSDFPEKKRFDLLSEAEEAAASARSHDGLRLFPYSCMSCSGYHLSKEQW